MAAGWTPAASGDKASSGFTSLVSGFASDEAEAKADRHESLAVLLQVLTELVAKHCFRARHRMPLHAAVSSCLAGRRSACTGRALDPSPVT